VKTEILTPCRSETPENIETKIGLNDYVMDPLQPCHFFCGNRSNQPNLLPIMLKYNLLVTLCTFPFFLLSPTATRKLSCHKDDRAMRGHENGAMKIFESP